MSQPMDALEIIEGNIARGDVRLALCYQHAAVTEIRKLRREVERLKSIRRTRVVIPMDEYRFLCACAETVEQEAR